MNETPLEDTQRLRRRLVDQAIALAMQGRWLDAIDVNRRVVDLEPDTEAWNRLGKAYSQLGRIRDARQAYHEALQSDPTNTIAKRNLERLALLRDDQPAAPNAQPGDAQSHRVSQQFFIEDTGKTTTREIFSDAPRDAVARVAPGDRVDLRADGEVIAIFHNSDRLGALEGRLSLRLRELMAGGNKYEAAIVSVEGRQVRLLIRETVQSASMIGRVSFPAEPSSSGIVRTFTKESTTHDDEDDDMTDADGSDSDADDANADFDDDDEADA